MDNQEIPRVSRAFDGLQLEVNALPDLIRDFGVTLFRALVGEVPQVGVFAALAAILGVLGVNEFRGDFKRWQQHIAFQHIGLASIRDRLRGFQRLRQIRKQFPHFGRRLEVELIVWHTKPELAAALADVLFRFADVLSVFHAQ